MNIQVYGGNFSGLREKSYGIQTIDINLHALPLEYVQKQIAEFIEFAKERPDTFLVDKFGSRSGFNAKDVAESFRPCLAMNNVKLPKEWLEILNA